jgi:hypothetical protein
MSFTFLRKSEEDDDIFLNVKTSKQQSLPDLVSDSILPTLDNETDGGGQIRDLNALKERMQDVIQILGDFKNRAESGRKRKDYLQVFF